MRPSQLSDIHASITEQLRSAGCVFAEEETDLIVAEAKTEGELKLMVEQRVAGLPLEHILGWAEFCGQRVIVGPGVFVPRRRSEFMIREAAKLTRTGSIVIDLGCGSGALGVALAAAVSNIQLYATDIDPVAVGYARANLTPIGGNVFTGDMYENLPASLHGRVDVLLVNAPYVPTDSLKFMPAEARLHEPLVALDGGSDGLDVQRRVAAGAGDWLAPVGKLFMETSRRQAGETVEIMTHHGLAARSVHDPELDATVVIAVKHSG